MVGSGLVVGKLQLRAGIRWVVGLGLVSRLSPCRAKKDIDNNFVLTRISTHLLNVVSFSALFW